MLELKKWEIHIHNNNLVCGLLFKNKGKIEIQSVNMNSDVPYSIDNDLFYWHVVNGQLQILDRKREIFVRMTYKLNLKEFNGIDEEGSPLNPPIDLIEKK